MSRLLIPLAAVLAMMWVILCAATVLTLTFIAAGIGWLLLAAVVVIRTVTRRWTSWHVTVALAVVLAGGISLGRADPPEGADPALHEFFQSLTQPGTGAICCSISDCRPVVTKWDHGTLWAFIDGRFPDNPEPNWYPVPPDHAIHGVPNQLGEPIACWYGREIRCFLDGGQS